MMSQTNLTLYVIYLVKSETVRSYLMHSCNVRLFEARVSSRTYALRIWTSSLLSIKNQPVTEIYKDKIGNVWVGYLSRYSDWLRTGRSGGWSPVGARFSPPVQTGPGVHPASCTMGTGSFPGVESGQGVTLIPHPFLVPRSKNRVELYLYCP
jgi:hypothetical protein